MLEKVRSDFHDLAPPELDFCTLRVVEELSEKVRVRQDVLQPVSASRDRGGMVTVHHRGGIGYAATSDLSREGLARAIQEARGWAERTAGRAVTAFGRPPVPLADGAYETPVRRPWDSLPLGDKIDLLRRESARLRSDERIVDWSAQLWRTAVTSLITQAGGGTVRQHLDILVPDLSATANQGAETITRTFGGFRLARQGGLEVLDQVGFLDAAPRLGAEAVELLLAPNCPTGTFELLLAPDQMILQIHESIGHPLELDRILGDERNYAGTSFVTLDMFGSYRYGSEHLNITFDPTRPEEVASYGFDDEGREARREHIIRDGILLRPLGATVSELRTGIAGVANARASSWNRPPIDRMANLNLEPGETSFAELVRSVERGVYMEANCSWSIDDSRNKFQFGCEYGRRIQDGELREVVKKPNYRGISATFWRSLKAVGDRASLEVLGTPFCGKGEPNQTVRVGHASPAALFEAVDVFGGM